MTAKYLKEMKFMIRDQWTTKSIKRSGIIGMRRTTWIKKDLIGKKSHHDGIMIEERNDPREMHETEEGRCETMAINDGRNSRRLTEILTNDERYNYERKKRYERTVME